MGRARRVGDESGAGLGMPVSAPPPAALRSAPAHPSPARWRSAELTEQVLYQVLGQGSWELEDKRGRAGPERLRAWRAPTHLEGQVAPGRGSSTLGPEGDGEGRWPGWQQTWEPPGICPADSSSGLPASGPDLRAPSLLCESRGCVRSAALTGGLSCCLPSSLPRPLKTAGSQ